MPIYLGGEEFDQGMDPVIGHNPTEKGQPQIVWELPHHQPRHSSLQRYAAHHPTKSIEK
ncbi:hypothetical protein DPMN_151298 [Dreissena polymorpha]|uniref:Uncharacterized protein n=1 Tax=Dreissena polymorpha TaxID=45954 RepID=A0A9D4FJ90_DREPO|nr:hypothetical protein DPMN_151298 [Dreissena polymorpha]